MEQAPAKNTRAAAPGSPVSARFPIAGVGASAGGLAATADLLRHLGSKPGVAVVIVHHLDPTHESSLVEILSRATALPVHTAADGMLVEANHVYVVPPNAVLLLADGTLKVTPRIETGGLHLPIDAFLESLAVDRAVYAVGVVLTGTGSDGTEGIKAIKAEGGITFAQDASAEYRAMPDSAIAAGCVDFVLSPEGIARELVRIGEHPPPLSAAADDAHDDEDLQRVLRALRKATGIDFANYKHTTVRRRVQRRVLVKSDGAYQIRKDVRDLCVFAKHDATRDPPFSGMDLVSCRNLLIYLGSVLQERLLPIFHYALKEPGFLLLGTSETVRSFPGFANLDAKNKIYTRTSAAPRLLFDFSEARPDELALAAPKARPSGTGDVYREADRLVLAEFAPPGVVITDDLAIVQFRGKTGPFLEPTPGVASFDLLRMVHEDLRLPLRQTIDEARSKRGAARRAKLQVGAGSTSRSIDIEAIPFGVASTSQRFFVVLFRETPPEPDVSAETGTVTPHLAVPPPAAESQLRQELASTRDYLESIIEQLEATNEELKAANEEIVSSNEELRSTNEELQMAKEELQATNEELRTVNEEMSVRNVEATRLNDDLTNILSSVEIPIVILDRDACVRRFTPAAAKLLRLTASDVGSPVTVLGGWLAPDLTQMGADVLGHLSTVGRVVQDDQGHWHQLSARPYLTTDNRIDGTVITVFDIDEIKKKEELLERAREYAESIVETVRECLAVLGPDLRVRSANRSFCQTFGVSPKDLEGRLFSELWLGEWNVPALIGRLEVLDEGDGFQDLHVEREFKGVGFRAFVLNAGRIHHTSSILLALEDVTEKKSAQEEAARTENEFRQMLTTAAEAILMTDATGKIVFANETAAQVFGYATGELLGLSVDQLVPQRLRDGHAKHRAEYLTAPTPRPMGRDRDLVGRRKDGTELPIEVVLGSMVRSGGPIVVSFINDITRRRESEKKIRDYQDKLQHMAFDATVAEERERRRIAADLHDRIGQSLALAQMKLTSARNGLVGPARKAIEEAVELLTESVAATRTLTFELSPPMLYDLGLNDALSWLVEDVEKRHGLRVELESDNGDKRLDDATAALVFRAVRELLVNVMKHAKVPAASISVKRVGDSVEVDVEDKGVGFDPQAVTASSTTGGFGLFSVREQIARLGGSVVVRSAPEQGTRVRLTVPAKDRGPQTGAPGDGR